MKIKMYNEFCRIVRRMYRIFYDYPFNWKPYGWDKSEMSESYWNGD